MQVSKLMVGGAKFQKAVLDWTNESNQLYTTVLVSLIFMWAIYAEKLPSQWRWQLSTTIGRLLLLVLLYIVYMLVGFLPALLFTVAIALTWANRPLHLQENFDVKTTKVNNHKWFVETALHEHPDKIVNDRVETSAIQEDSAVSSGRTSR